MAEREKYYIGLNGQIFEVSKELYETYYANSASSDHRFR